MPYLSELDHLPVSTIAIELLKDADSPRSSGEDLEHARALAQSEDPLPPIIVSRPTMQVIDGMHRLRAAKLRGEKSIEARFFDGDQASSFVLAVQANIRHGLPLSLADRKAAAARIITSFPEWSDRMIATAAGLAASTVAALRGCPGAAEHQTDMRVGRDGRARPVNSAERRVIARKLLEDEPDASLRDIARKAGISPETARNVRARLHNEGNPGSLAQHNFREVTGEAGRRRQAQDKAAGPDRPGVNAARSLRSLIADPALRSTETGRSLLRLLCTYRVIEEKGEKLIEAVPAHCVERVADTVCASALLWQDFASEFERRRQHALEECP